LKRRNSWLAGRIEKTVFPFAITDIFLITTQAQLGRKIRDTIAFPVGIY